MPLTAFVRRVVRAPAVWALLLAACAGSNTDRTDSATLQAAVSDALVGPGVREGTWQDADERSTWRATLDGPRITRIDEVSTFTDSAQSTRQFGFDSTEQLTTFREERRQLIYGATAAPDTVQTLIELEWQQDSLARSAKRVDGADRLLQPFEIDNFRAHAAELLRVVRAGTTTSPRTPTP
jgi:hypothetical protein